MSKKYITTLQNKTDMKRDIDTLAEKEFDLLVIGGGIYGATVAWEAVLRGLSVALIEKGDFASGTSSNSLKIIHGGLRYIQHADFKRMRESIRERRILLKIAPHLVHPLPCVMPTYGHFVKGPEALRVALLINDLVSFDRNRLDDPEKHLPNGKIISKKELLGLLPFVDQNNLTGGAIWYDARMYNSERLALSFLKAAVAEGAVAANYVKAEDMLYQDDRVVGVRAREVMSGDTFNIRAKMTLNTAGPWINNILAMLNGKTDAPKIPYSSALNLVIKRTLSQDYAFGVSSKRVFKDQDAVISKGSRLLFAVPWRDVTLIGTAHKPYDGDAEAYRPSEEDIAEFLQEVNEAMPDLQIARREVTFQYGGLLPMDGVNEQTGDVRLTKHFRIIDHQIADGLAGLLSVMSVKYTTARDVAEKAIDLVLQKFDRQAKSQSADRRVWGGNIDRFDAFLSGQIEKYKHSFSQSVVRQLVLNYGSGMDDVLKLAQENSDLARPLSQHTNVLRAEVVYAVRHEMAQNLSDVVFRRTELATTGHPGGEALQSCAQLVARELGWNAGRTAEEVAAVERCFQVK